MGMALSAIRTFTNPNRRFVETSPDSLINYVLLMYGEIREKALTEPDKNMAAWYSDVAALVLELGTRYESLKPKAEGEPSKSSER